MADGRGGGTGRKGNGPGCNKNDSSGGVELRIPPAQNRDSAYCISKANNHVDNADTRLLKKKMESTGFIQL